MMLRMVGPGGTTIVWSWAAAGKLVGSIEPSVDLHQPRGSHFLGQFLPVFPYLGELASTPTNLKGQRFLVVRKIISVPPGVRKAEAGRLENEKKRAPTTSRNETSQDDSLSEKEGDQERTIEAPVFTIVRREENKEDTRVAFFRYPHDTVRICFAARKEEEEKGEKEGLVVCAARHKHLLRLYWLDCETAQYYPIPGPTHFLANCIDRDLAVTLTQDQRILVFDGFQAELSPPFPLSSPFEDSRPWTQVEVTQYSHSS